MAHIQKLTDKRRTLPWRAQVRRKGHKVMVKMFMTKAEAQAWADEQERTIRLTGLPLTIDDLKKQTVGDIVLPPPMPLGNLRANGVWSILVCCSNVACRHEVSAIDTAIDAAQKRAAILLKPASR